MTHLLEGINSKKLKFVTNCLYKKRFPKKQYYRLKKVKNLGFTEVNIRRLAEQRGRVKTEAPFPKQNGSLKNE